MTTNAQEKLTQAALAMRAYGEAKDASFRSLTYLEAELDRILGYSEMVRERDKLKDNEHMVGCADCLPLCSRAMRGLHVLGSEAALREGK